MTEFARRTEGDDDTHAHLVRWRESAWDRIARAADVLTARKHQKQTATDIIREGTMRYVDEVLGTSATGGPLGPAA